MTMIRFHSSFIFKGKHLIPNVSVGMGNGDKASNVIVLVYNRYWGAPQSQQPVNRVQGHRNIILEGVESSVLFKKLQLRTTLIRTHL